MRMSYGKHVVTLPVILPFLAFVVKLSEEVEGYDCVHVDHNTRQ